MSSSSFLAQPFWKETSRYCHSPVIVGMRLTVSNVSVSTEDIYLKLDIEFSESSCSRSLLLKVCSFILDHATFCVFRHPLT